MTDNTSNIDKDPQLTTDALFQIFTDSNIIIILWFLAVYFVVYLMLNIFRGKDGVRSHLSRWIDAVALLCLLIYLIFTYFEKSETEKKRIVSELYLQFKSYLNSPLSLISIGFFIFTLYVVVYILEIPMDSFGKPITISIIENSAWILFVLVLFSTFLKYIANASMTNFMDDAGNYFNNKGEQAYIIVNAEKTADGETAKATSTPAPVQSDEVFNIGNNMFTYDDAQSVCASYGARLATYDEVESTYNNGGEWCNYGWSDGQAIYFPTQKATWEKLQKSEHTKNSCGRPGVNGGYIENSNDRYGVNCFGKKPKPSSSDLAAISAGVNVPKTQEDILLEQKIAFWNANRDKLLKVNSYNNAKWSMY